MQESFGRLVATGIFYFTKVRIKSILQQVYEYEVDDELAKSIAMAAEDPGAIGTFYQLSLAGGRTEVAAGELREKFEGPPMLLWGEKDPRMTPTKAERIMEIASPDARARAGRRGTLRARRRSHGVDAMRADWRRRRTPA